MTEAAAAAIEGQGEQEEAPQPQKRVPTFAAFGNKDFSVYTALRVGATIGENMLAVAVGWQVFAITGSAFDLGLVGLMLFIPRLLFVLPAGQLADKFDRRVLIGLGMVAETISVALLLALSLSGNHKVWPIMCVLVLVGTAEAVVAPAYRSMLPRLVSLELLPNALTWNNSLAQVSVVLGPPLAGFLYIAGASTVLSVVVGALALATISAWLLKPQTVLQATNELSVIDNLLAGLRFVWSQPVILGAVSLDLFAVLLGGATALLPIFAASILHAGPIGLGLLRSAPAVGSVIGAAGLARFQMRHHVGRRMLYCVAGFGLATVVFGLSRNIALSMVALAILGFCDAISVFVRQALVQLWTPNSMRGRVGAVHMLFVGTSNQLGEFESGVTASLFGTVPAVVLGGMGTLVVVALWAVLFRDLRNIDKFEPPAKRA